jgi:hypothetical protein
VGLARAKAMTILSEEEANLGEVLD